MPDTDVVAASPPAAPPADSEPFQTGQVITMSIGHAVHDTYTAFLPSLLPVFIANLALSKTKAGLLTVFIQGPSVVQPFIGHLADRLSLRILFILAPAVTATVMSLLGVAPSYTVVALLLVVAGLSSSSLHATGPAIAGHVSGANLGRGMGFWMVGGELGRTLGPLVIVTAIRFLTLEGTPWLMVGGLGLSAVLYLRLRSVPEHRALGGQALPWRRALRTMGPLLIPLATVLTARAFMESALTTYLPTFLSEEGADLWFAGAALSILQTAGVVGALLGGSISDRLGRRSILFVSMLVTPALMFLFLATGGWARLPLLLAMGFTALSAIPVLMALAQESLPDNRALANGIYMAIGFILRSGVIVALGALGDALGLRKAFAISAVIPLLSLPLVFLLPGGRGHQRGA